MLRIRLRRVGKKKQPMYRIVVAESHAPRDGAFVENLGYYHPMDNPSTIVLDEERAKHWLDKGAIPSDRVSKILKIQGIAEIPPKLAARIALGEERAKGAKEASKAKADADASADASGAEAKAPAEAPKAEATETKAAEAPATEAPKAEAPAAKEAATEAPKAEATETKAVEEPATEEPKTEAPTEDAADKGEEKSES